MTRRDIGVCGLHPGGGCGLLVTPDDLAAEDSASLNTGCHYDYRRQRWLSGHDHAHRCADRPELVLLYCGADRATCTGQPDPAA